MTNPKRVADHYAHGDLLNAIRAGVAALGRDPGRVEVDDLAPVDEFHVGGRQASEDLFDQLDLSPDDHLLDVGCGLGGTARFAASRFGGRVTGLDLTPEYVATGSVLCDWVGLGDRIDLRQGDALSMPFDEARFDGAYMFHVGMNIEDKEGLFAEVHRVLRPGAWFGIYDVMRTGEGALTYPVPWAATSETSAVASPERYRKALAGAGFTVTAERDRRDFALAFFERLRARSAGGNAPPPLGIHILMGDTAAAKVGNMIDNITAGWISPVEIIARKTR